MKEQNLSKEHEAKMIATKLQIVKLIHFDITSCTDIAYIIGISKSAVSQHVKVLYTYGYIDIIYSGERYQKKKYQMTARGEALLKRLA